MVKYIICMIVALTCAAVSHAAEIATVLGQPNGALDFVQNIVQERIVLAGPSSADDPSTWVYSILSRKGVKSAVSIEVIQYGGSVKADTFVPGLQAGAAKAPVVFSNIGPVDNDLCGLMGNYNDTAFVVVAGNDAMRLDPVTQPKCLARNILRVAALDQTKGDLMSFANWGPLVRIASPSNHIPAIGVDGKVNRNLQNTTIGSALVAGRLAVYAAIHFELKGTELIERFLNENSVQLSPLRGKVEGARALVDTE